MSHSKIQPWSIIFYGFALVLFVILTGLAFGWLSTIALEAESTLIGALLGVVDAFVPLLLSLLLSKVNQTLGKVSIILLLLEQVVLIVFFFIGVPFIELLQTGFIVAQAVIYVMAIIGGLCAALSNK